MSRGASQRGGYRQKNGPSRGWKEVKIGGDDRTKLNRSKDWKSLVVEIHSSGEKWRVREEQRERERERRKGETGHKVCPLWSEGRMFELFRSEEVMRNDKS